MKKKYFMRGLGTGVVFATIIMLAAYMTSGSWQKMSDDEIKKRALKLGMVEKELVTEVLEPVEETSVAQDSITDLIDNKKEETTTEKATTEEKTTEATTKETTEEVTTEEVTTEEKTTEEVTTEEKTTEATTEKETTEKQDSKTKVKITVKGGMGSEQIAKLLADAGLVKSAADFDSFLCQNGYDSSLEVGTFELDGSMTYDEMAKVLCKRK